MADDGPREWTFACCAIHEHHTDTDCEYCEEELDQKKAAMEDIVKMMMMQDGKMRAMTASPQNPDGVSFLMSPLATHIKIDTLIASIFTDPKVRMNFELNTAQNLVNAMQVQESNIARRQLTHGINGIDPRFMR